VIRPDIYSAPPPVDLPEIHTLWAFFSTQIAYGLKVGDSGSRAPRFQPKSCRAVVTRQRNRRGTALASVSIAKSVRTGGTADRVG